MWSLDNGKSTRDLLRADYPGYSLNELYAIWCHLHGKIPLDHNGKLILEQWQIHAAADGEHVQEGGFKVSPAFFGRARKAVPGQTKPAQAPRSAASREHDEPLTLSSRAAFSPQAAEFGRAYDQASALLPSLIATQKQFHEMLDQFRGFPPGVLQELSHHHSEVSEILALPRPQRGSGPPQTRKPRLLDYDDS